MDMKMAENIRAFRKQRGLTQEKLAEVLGVTTGAVHKWEAGLSIPELPLILDMADFFDVSVDALIGYQMKDNHADSALGRISEYTKTRDPEALAEAEKALLKYPNSFEVVHGCAQTYFLFGAGGHNEAQLRRGLELMNRCRSLVSQNQNPEMNEYTLYGEMAGAYLLLGEEEKGIELLKRHNLGGMFSDAIGVYLAIHLKRHDEARPYLSEALLGSVATLMNTVYGYAIVYFHQNDYAQAEDILNWSLNILHGLKAGEEADFLDKMSSLMLTLLAYAQYQTGDIASATETMEKVSRIVSTFDANPDYAVSFRFKATPDEVRLYDILGNTATESVESILRSIEADGLLEIWNGMRRNDA
ncbi:MAG: helix-turn-helix transcriptional regulator [Spirochaetales bacterium]|nr:helix-turn-helix transcriptional regulator [Spirochaetales bacterium]